MSSRRSSRRSSMRSSTGGAVSAAADATTADSSSSSSGSSHGIGTATSPTLHAHRHVQVGSITSILPRPCAWSLCTVTDATNADATNASANAGADAGADVCATNANATPVHPVKGTSTSSALHASFLLLWHWHCGVESASKSFIFGFRAACGHATGAPELERAQEGGSPYISSVYLMSKNGPIVIGLPTTSPVSDQQLRQGEWGPQN
jgi:hypothetical protein